MPFCTVESLDRRVEVDGQSNATNPAAQGENNRHIVDIGFKTCTRWRFIIHGDSIATEFMTSMQERMLPKESLLDCTIAFDYTPPFKIEQNGTYLVRIHRYYRDYYMTRGKNSDSKFESPSSEPL